MAQLKSNSRDNILDAAQRVAEREGAGNLTLDKVACECGLSKGGLLYNYPNKESLLKGMIDRLIDQHKRIADTEEKAMAGEPNANLRATLRAVAGHQMVDPGIYMCILTASAQNPELLEPIREAFRDSYERITAECTDPDMGLLLWAAADGILFHHILGIAPYPKTEKIKLFQKLLQLSEELT
ncbi:MAG: TetR/AcrR family transcriptional regulator [Pseudohongiella sp.]|uniref:TetR/AcrR family transcriptional regulator n=1 Tax=Pseudohongiella sp. TaxID=1979412 RepID=UPI0034A06487